MRGVTPSTRRTALQRKSERKSKRQLSLLQPRTLWLAKQPFLIVALFSVVFSSVGEAAPPEKGVQPAPEKGVQPAPEKGVQPALEKAPQPSKTVDEDGPIAPWPELPEDSNTTNTVRIAEDETHTPPVASAGPSIASSTSWAIAPGIASAQRRDNASSSRTNLLLDLALQNYRHYRERFFLRPSVRLGFLGVQQSEQPQSVQIREYDLTTRAEVAALFDGPVVPMVAMGVGLITRRISLSTADPIVGNADPISRWKLYPEIYAKAGIGVPLLDSLFVVEPYLGYRVVVGDNREGLLTGIDVSVALP